MPWIYNPLDYAWAAHEQYIRRYAQASCEVVLVGMNPGPWGMAQTGVPFGQIAAARDWLELDGEIRKPKREHRLRPIEGWACKRSEVSGERLWGLFKARYTTPDRFFAKHFVCNYCPLVFMEESARNLTPDKLPSCRTRAAGGNLRRASARANSSIGTRLGHWRGCMGRRLRQACRAKRCADWQDTPSQPGFARRQPRLGGYSHFPIARIGSLVRKTSDPPTGKGSPIGRIAE